MLEEALKTITDFSEDFQKNKKMNILASVFGGGMTKKLGVLQSLTENLTKQLERLQVEINQMSLEKTAAIEKHTGELAKAENAKYDAAKILISKSAQKFWLKYVGKEV
jgi:hypothetical protein